MAEHVVDWRFEGASHAVAAKDHGPGLAAQAALLLDAIAHATPDLNAPLELSILLTDDGGIKPLNGRWRGRDVATDVLSFPLEEGPVLGDVVISVQTAAGRVDVGVWELEDELLFLLIHGTLHLVGHDHQDPAERDAMEAEEQRLWTVLGRTGTLRDPQRTDDHGPDAG